MTKKEREISLGFHMLKGKDVLVYTNIQKTHKQNEPMYEGTAVDCTNGYIFLRNCLMWHGGFKDEVQIHIGKIMRIEPKNKS